MKLGTIERVSLRDIWKNEERDFTPWLEKQENLDMLSEQLGISLIEPKREVRIGSFECDMTCKVESDERLVVIENQLEDSNHDHLGKTIVYASGIGASIIIWIVKTARSEHISAIEWLNEHTDSDISFFLIELEAIKIGDSLPAPQFRIKAEPNDYAKTVKGSSDKELTRSQAGRYDFWTKMNDYFKDNEVGLRTRRPTYDHWYDFAMGCSSYHISVNLIDSDNKIRILWYSGNPEKQHYDKLHKNKPEIEEQLSAFGALEWDRKDGQKASWIATYIPNFSFDNTNNWEEHFKEIAVRVKKFQEVLKKYL
ncbi:MAG: DUF4268 domain-containing protein [Oscillospiraceae bacterium]|nr:DUF4268 domain-containing protein [Oscillospiraceae bacterium]